MNMIAHVTRIVRSYFSLPVWVIAWIGLFLVPVNMAGFWFLDTASGRWIAVLGATGILLNLPLVWLNGGLSKVLCITHIVFWTPLVLVLGYRLVTVPLTGSEFHLAVAALAVNGISLLFDYYDFFDWRRGNRAVAGFPDDPVRF
jgi:hypothetical protein